LFTSFVSLVLDYTCVHGTLEGQVHRRISPICWNWEKNIFQISMALGMN